MSKNPCITGLDNGEKKNPYPYKRGRICISTQMIRWQTLRDALHLRSHAELARYLLDWYYSHQSCNNSSTTSTDTNPNHGIVEKCNNIAQLDYKVQDKAGYHFASQEQNNSDYKTSCQDHKKDFHLDVQEEKIAGFPLESLEQNKDGFLLDGQDIQVFDTTSNELVFRTSLTGPKLPSNPVKPRRYHKRKVPYRQPLRSLRPLWYTSDSDFDEFEEEAINLDPDDPPYVPTEKVHVNGSLSMSLRRRIGRQWNGDDINTKRIKTEEGVEAEIKESNTEKLVTNSSNGKQLVFGVEIKKEKENALQKNLFGEKPLQNNSVDEKLSQNNSVDEKPSQINYVEEKPSQINSMEEKPSQINSMEEKPSQINSMEEKPSQINSMEEKPSQINSMEEKPSQINSMEEKPLQNISVDEKSSQINYVEEKPSQINYVEEKPSQINYVEEKRSQINSMEEKPLQNISIDEKSSQINSVVEKILQNNSLEEKTFAKNYLEKQPDVETEIQNGLKIENSDKKLVKNCLVEKAMENESIADKDMGKKSMEENSLENTSTKENPTKEMSMKETSMDVNENV